MLAFDEPDALLEVRCGSILRVDPGELAVDVVDIVDAVRFPVTLTAAGSTTVTSPSFAGASPMSADELVD